MKFLFKLFLIALILLVGYNFFFGDQDEKQQSQEIIGQVEDLGKSIGSLIKAEKEKFDEGKYEDALANINGLIHSLKEKLSDLDLKSRLDQLESEKNKLSDTIEKLRKEEGGISPESKRALNEELDGILKELEKIGAIDQN